MLPATADVKNAAQQIGGVVDRTPVLRPGLGEFRNGMSRLARI
jgi:hypothetical protein